MFLTTADFLPVHRAHREQVAHLVATATARGQTRLVEMNQHVLDNLDQIICGLGDVAEREDPVAVSDAR